MGGTGMAKVTLKQISEVTGYSQATVSNALNRKKDMNEETVSQILQAAKNLGYKISDKLIGSCWLCIEKADRF